MRGMALAILVVGYGRVLAATTPDRFTERQKGWVVGGFIFLLANCATCIMFGY